MASPRFDAAALWRALAVVGCVALVVVALGSAAWGAERPIFSGDEVGHLLLSRHIAGEGTWVLTGSTYYVGWAALIAPLWWFVEDPALVYRLVIASQVLVGLLGTAGLYVLARALRCSPGWSLLIATAVSVTPSRVYGAGFAVPEMFGGTLVIWLVALVALDERRRRRWFLWLVLPLVVLLILVHPRFAPLSLVLLAHVAVRARDLRPAGRWLTALGLVLTVGGLFPVLLLASRAQAAVFPDSARASGLLAHAPELLSVAGVAVAAGHVWYGVVAFGGATVLGLCAAAPGAVRSLLRGRSGTDLVVVAGTAGVGLLGLLQVAPGAFTGARLDYWVYGRYVEPCWAVLAAVGLVALARRPSAGLRLAAAAVFVGVVAVAGVVLAPTPVSQTIWVPFNVSALVPWSWSDGDVGYIPWAEASVVAGFVFLLLLVAADAPERWRTVVVVAVTCATVVMVATVHRTAFDRFEFLYRGDGAALHEPVLAAPPTDVLLDRDTVRSTPFNLYTWHLSGRDLTQVRGSELDPDDLGPDTWVLAGGGRPRYLPTGSVRVLTDNYAGVTLWLTPGELLDELRPRVQPASECLVDVDVEPDVLGAPIGADVSFVVTVSNESDGTIRVDASRRAIQLRLFWNDPQELADTVIALPRDLLRGDELRVLVNTSVPLTAAVGEGDLRFVAVQATGQVCGEDAVAVVDTLIAP